MRLQSSLQWSRRETLAGRLPGGVEDDAVRPRTSLPGLPPPFAQPERRRFATHVAVQSVFKQLPQTRRRPAHLHPTPERCPPDEAFVLRKNLAIVPLSWAATHKLVRTSLSFPHRRAAAAARVHYGSTTTLLVLLRSSEIDSGPRQWMVPWTRW